MNCFKENKYLIFQDSERGEAKFDLSTSECWRYYNNKWRPVKSLNGYFRNVSVESVTRSLLESDPAYSRFIERVATYNDLCSNVGTFLGRLHKLAHLENYCLLGIKVSCNVRKPTSFYPKDILRIFSKHGDIPIVNESFEDLVIHNKEMMFNFLRYIESKWGEYPDDFNKVITPFLTYGRYTMADYASLINDYKYEYKRLIDYAFWHIPRYEGIEIKNCVSYLQDYAHMKTRMGVKFEKYPKFLHSVHDITVLAYNKMRKEYNEEIYKSTIDKSLEFTSGAYSVIYPSTTEEIKLEGASLSHCVASYIQDVVDEKTRILFLRKKDEPDVSLVTIEVKGNDITQVRGYLNRDPNDEESAFLKLYAEKMKLNCSASNFRF